ncbi:MAG: hypothetical protein ACRC1H_13045 [Caldilineaceae bacterium]
MASSLSLQVGALQRTATASASDTQVAEALKAFAFATGAPLDATNNELADHVLAELAQHMVRVGRRWRLAEAARLAEGSAISEVEF